MFFDIFLCDMFLCFYCVWLISFIFQIIFDYIYISIYYLFSTCFWCLGLLYIYMCVLFDVLELFCFFSHCFWHITWCFVFLLPFLGCWICLFNLLLFFQFRFKFFFPVDLFCWGVEFLFGLLDWFFGRFVSLFFF